MLTQSDVLFLSSAFTFWNHLSPNEKTLILNNATLMTYHKGESLHSGDNDCVGVFLVKSGSLRTYLLSDEGKEVTLYRLFSGEVCMLSASCLLKNITFDVHIDAATKTEVILLNSAVFSSIVEKNIYAENFSYKIAMDRFSDVIWAMEQILFMSFDQRLAIFLLDESQKNNTDTIILTHEEIAKYLGSAREVVSRMLKHFEKEGFVSLFRGGVTLLDKSQLKQLA
ncbi:MAG: Crp/Fnr family transcriptional regulator [Eubacteriaceae bacterium]